MIPSPAARSGVVRRRAVKLPFPASEACLLLVALALPVAGQAPPQGCALPLDVPLTVAEPAGVARPAEPVTAGVPLPENANLRTTAGLAVFDGATPLPTQLRVLSRWGGPPSDASKAIRWLLVDFQVGLAPNEVKTVRLRAGTPPAPPAAITVSSGTGALVVDTGPLQATLASARGALLERAVVLGQVVLDDPTPDRQRSGIRLTMPGGVSWRSAADLAPQILVEESGALRTVVRITSRLVGPQGTALAAGGILVVARLHFHAGHADVRAHVELRNDGAYGDFGCYCPNAPSPATLLDFDGLRWELPLALPGSRSIESAGFAGSGPDTDVWRIYQSHQVVDPNDETQNFSWSLARNGATAAAGARHAGWIAARTAAAGVGAGVRWFWQNYEKALRVERDRLSVELWPEEDCHPADRQPPDLFRFEGGRRKSHEVLLRFHGAAPGSASAGFARLGAPVAARAPAAWYAASGALGMADPGGLVFAGTANDVRANQAYVRRAALLRKVAGGLPPDAGTAAPVRNIVEAKERRFRAGTYDTGDWYGWPHFGDCVWGGGGYSSNHYDLPASMMLHFLVTGDRALWDLAEPHVRQAAEFGQVWGVDPNPFVPGISFYEKTNHGLSPENLRPAPSHNWIRRLALYHWLTGSPAALDAAIFNAQQLRRYFYQAWDITNPAGIAFVPGTWSILAESRFLTWSLENALDAHALTGDPQWMAMADDLVAAVHYVFTNSGHLDGPGPGSLGGNLMSNYGSEPLIRYHAAASSPARRAQALAVLRGLLANVYERDRVPAQGSGAGYRPAALVSDWDDGNAGPDNITTIYNGFAASVYGYVGLMDGNATWLRVAQDLWTDGIFYPAYWSGYPVRDPRDQALPDTWSWQDGTFPNSEEKLWARMCRQGQPFLWVMDRVLAARHGLQTRVGGGAFSADVKAFWANDAIAWRLDAALAPALAGAPAAVLVNLPAQALTPAATPLPGLPGPCTFPGLTAVHAYSSPPGPALLAGDGLGLASVLVGFPLGSGPAAVGTSSPVIVIPPGLFAHGDVLRLQAIVLVPPSVSAPGAAATNEVLLVARDPAL